ncbi:hypothetical protein [Dysgonomonas termitidis]|uniref:DUF2970 domain-containing protein n=1 Tax=Dysgonomonas termitidis TaxID=1516126 RepID=A0ABV9KUX9_9BACT
MKSIIKKHAYKAGFHNNYGKGFTGNTLLSSIALIVSIVVLIIKLIN